MKINNYTSLYLKGFYLNKTFILEQVMQEQNVNSLFNNRQDMTNLLVYANQDQLRYFFYKIKNDLPNADVTRFINGLIELTQTQNYSNASQEIVKRLQDNYGAYVNPSNTPTVSKIYKALQQPADLNNPPRPMENFGARATQDATGPDTGATDAAGATGTDAGATDPTSSGGTTGPTGPQATPPPSAAEQEAPSDKEKELFKKFHNSDYDPGSPVDRKKLEQLRQAAQSTGSDDEAALRAAAYRLQYGGSVPTSSQSRNETPAQTRRRLLQPIEGMYVRTGFNQFRPAVQADMKNQSQLFMKNPNPVFRSVNPYVKVDSDAVKRAQRGTESGEEYDKRMRSQDAQRLGPGGVRTEKGGRKERKSQFGGVLGSLSNFAGDVGNTLTGR